MIRAFLTGVLLLPVINSYSQDNSNVGKFLFGFRSGMFYSTNFGYFEGLNGINFRPFYLLEKSGDSYQYYGVNISFEKYLSGKFFWRIPFSTDIAILSNKIKQKDYFVDIGFIGLDLGIDIVQNNKSRLNFSTGFNLTQNLPSKRNDRIIFRNGIHSQFKISTYYKFPIKNTNSFVGLDFIFRLNRSYADIYLSGKVDEIVTYNILNHKPLICINLGITI